MRKTPELVMSEDRDEAIINQDGKIEQLGEWGEFWILDWFWQSKSIKIGDFQLTIKIHGSEAEKKGRTGSLMWVYESKQYFVGLI